jgi:hypothetical protein
MQALNCINVVVIICAERLPQRQTRGIKFMASPPNVVSDNRLSVNSFSDFDYEKYKKTPIQNLVTKEAQEDAKVEDATLKDAKVDEVTLKDAKVDEVTTKDAKVQEEAKAVTKDHAAVDIKEEAVQKLRGKCFDLVNQLTSQVSLLDGEKVLHHYVYDRNSEVSDILLISNCRLFVKKNRKVLSKSHETTCVYLHELSGVSIAKPPTFGAAMGFTALAVLFTLATVGWWFFSTTAWAPLAFVALVPAVFCLMFAYSLFVVDTRILTIVPGKIRVSLSRKQAEACLEKIERAIARFKGLDEHGIVQVHQRMYLRKETRNFQELPKLSLQTVAERKCE